MIDSTALEAKSSRGGALRSAAALLTVTFLLGGCAWIDRQLEGGWFDFSDDDQQASRLSSEAQVGEDEEFPNLATVPDQPPETSSAAERAEISSGLVADRSNAQYTDETLVAGQAEGVSSAAPPVETLAEAPTSEAATGTQMATTGAAATSTTTVTAGTGGTGGEALAGEEEMIPTIEPAPGQPVDRNMVAALSPTTATQGMAPANAVTVDYGALDSLPAPAPAGAASASVGQVATSAGEPVALIYFNHGSSGLNAEARQVLRQIAALYRERGGTVRVVGHASMRTRTMDPASHQLANFNVSLSRAGAVAGELIRLGIRPDKVQIAGLAAELPVYHEFMPTGEAGNRRAEIYLY